MAEDLNILQLIDKSLAGQQESSRGKCAWLDRGLIASSKGGFVGMREVVGWEEASESSAPPGPDIGDLLMVVPTYNEAANMQPLIDRVDRVRRRLPFALVVVDDNSPDGTGDIVNDLRAERPWLSLLERDTPRGLGSAYRAGFQWGLERGFRYIGEMDADLSHDPAYIPPMYDAVIAGADLALGSRYVSGGGTAGWSAGRKLLSRGGNIFARSMLHLEIRDVTGGLRIYTRRAVETLLEQGSTECRGYGFQIEGAYAVKKAGFRMSEVPIVFRERVQGESKFSRAIALEAARRCIQLAATRSTWPSANGVSVEDTTLTSAS